MKLGNETKVSAELTVTPAPTCPCCGSKNYHLMVTYSAAGEATGKSSTCLDCRDNWCKNCGNGD